MKASLSDAQNDAVSRLMAGVVDQATAVIVREAVTSGNAPILLQNFLEASGEEVASDKVDKVMAVLERLAEVDRVSACLLMAHLYPVAADLFSHEICDSISLWLTQGIDSDTQQLIKKLILGAGDEGLASSFKKWL